MEAFPKDALLLWSSSLHSILLRCRYLESLAGISPQLYADNLKCTSFYVDSVLAAAQYTVSYVHAVG